jgi:predicted transposase/invertase (TIGR01784 family)
MEEVIKITTKEEQWLAYLSCGLNKDELEELFKMNENKKEVNEIVEKVLASEDIQQELMYRRLDANLDFLKRQRAYENGVEEGKKQGIEEGSKEKQLEMAKKMLNKNEPIEKIIEFTGLTKEEIENIK